MDQIVSTKWTIVLAAAGLYALAVMAVAAMVYVAGDVTVAPVTFSAGGPFSSLQDLMTSVPILKDGNVPIPIL
jgi:hypothetical protein